MLPSLQGHQCICGMKRMWGRDIYRIHLRVRTERFIGGMSGSDPILGSEEISGRAASGSYGTHPLPCGEKIRDKGIGDTPGT